MYAPHFFALALFSALVLLLNWKLEKSLHARRLNSIRLRIHVNGIRGKSTVTRIVAGILRAADIQTFAKTTGSAACTIDTDGVDHPIDRNGSPTILEQVEIIRQMDRHIDAMVVECMAIKPEYQRICEQKIVRANIGIITNVREDHQEVLGHSLEEIAQSLLSTCPKNGVLITAESNPTLLPIFRRIAESNQTRLIVADPNHVKSEEMQDFSYVAFKDNVAIGFELAKLLNIDRKTALKGMAAAAADPGSLRITQISFENQTITWADMFAVNDRESVIAGIKQIHHRVPPNAIKIGLLNNRSDREHRAIQFAKIAARDLKLDFFGLMGAYENQVASKMVEFGCPESQIFRLGNQTGAELIEQIMRKCSSKDVLLIGMVNIHTTQAESLREFFSQKEANK